MVTFIFINYVFRVVFMCFAAKNQRRKLAFDLDFELLKPVAAEIIILVK